MASLGMRCAMASKLPKTRSQVSIVRIADQSIRELDESGTDFPKRGEFIRPYEAFQR